jgi:hypothetical protein
LKSLRMSCGLFKCFLFWKNLEKICLKDKRAMKRPTLTILVYIISCGYTVGIWPFNYFTIFLFSQLITTFCYCNKSKLILRGTQFTFINNTFLISVKCGQSRKKWDEFSFAFSFTKHVYMQMYNFFFSCSVNQTM